MKPLKAITCSIPVMSIRRRMGPSATRPMYANGAGFSGKVIANESLLTSSYNSMVVSVEKRMSNNVSFLGGYRWAKCIDVGGSISSFAVNEFTDPRHPSLDRGICDSDLAQQFKMARCLADPQVQFAWHCWPGGSGRLVGKWDS